MSSEDEEIARTTALSLQDTKQQPELINIDEGSGEQRFQEELQRALKASQDEYDSQSKSGNSSSQTVHQSNPPQAVSSFLSERAQLEKEGPEREKGLQPPSSRGSTTEDADENEDDEPPVKRQVSSCSSSFKRSNIPSVSGSTQSNAIPTIEEMFWNGELRQTATRHDVLGEKSELAFGIMSSFVLNLKWIYGFFDRSVPVIMVAHSEGPAAIKKLTPHWIITTPSLQAGYGCHHMKFMLLFYKTGRLRVVISSANLIASEWRDLENHPNLPLKSIDELGQKWDWSNVKVQLVASIAGKHEGWPRVIQAGHPHLMMAVRKLGMRTGTTKNAKDLLLEYQGSSTGGYTTQWLNEFHWSARGESAEAWLDDSKISRERLPYPPVKIVFPTNATVKASAEGEQGVGGASINCRRRQWNARNFPRGHFFDSKSKGGPVLMHSKMIIAMLQNNYDQFSGKTNQHFSHTKDDTGDNIEAVGWAYVGSHNFTPSAWGILSGSSLNPVLNIANYEVGIVFLSKDATEASRIACFQRPPKKYTSKDEPWVTYFDSVYSQGLITKGLFGNDNPAHILILMALDYSHSPKMGRWTISVLDCDKSWRFRTPHQHPMGAAHRRCSSPPA
ncbi:phospholipase D/nuclease [Phlegmacium glaucopus]|nr:phospholipase D/nuclease [Phlegmacium glaucopus]